MAITLAATARVHPRPRREVHQNSPSATVFGHQMDHLRAALGAAPGPGTGHRRRRLPHRGVLQARGQGSCSCSQTRTPSPCCPGAPATAGWPGSTATCRQRTGSPSPRTAGRFCGDAVRYVRKRGLRRELRGGERLLPVPHRGGGGAYGHPLRQRRLSGRGPEDKGEDVRRDICLTLEEMGIEPQYSQHISGPGQKPHRLRPRPRPALRRQRDHLPLGGEDDGGPQRPVGHLLPQAPAGGGGNGFRIAMRPTKDGGALRPTPSWRGSSSAFWRCRCSSPPRRNLTSGWAPFGAPDSLSWADTGRGSLLRRKAGGRIELSAADGAANPYLCVCPAALRRGPGGGAGPCPAAGLRGAFGPLPAQSPGPVPGEPVPAGAACPRRSSVRTPGPGGTGPAGPGRGKVPAPMGAAAAAECGFPQTGAGRQRRRGPAAAALRGLGPAPDRRAPARRVRATTWPADAAAQGLPCAPFGKGGAVGGGQQPRGGRQRGVLTLGRPFSKAVFAQAAGMLRASQARVGKLQAEGNKKLRQKLEELRLISRAKCLLVEYLHLDEEGGP